MTKFHFQPNGQTGAGCPIYEVTHVESGKFVGHVHISVLSGWVALAPERGPDIGHRTRQAAAERLLLVSGVNPVQWAALPTDPFEGVSA